MIIQHDAPAVKTPRTPNPSANGLDGIPVIVDTKNSGYFMPRSKTWYRRIIGSRHLLKKPQAGTFDCAALALVQDMGATSVRLVDSETGIEYTAPIQLIHEYGFDLDRGFGKQKALLLGYFVRSDAHGNVTPATLPKAAPAATVEPEQPALFDFAEPVKRGGY